MRDTKIFADNDLSDAQIWAALDHELDIWASEKRDATLWWRDDDAERITPGLRRLLDLCREWEVPVAAAIIPGVMAPDLLPYLDESEQTAVLQHGYTHTNHSRAQQAPSEFPEDRDDDVMLAELKSGLQQILIAANALPVLVPPWHTFPDRFIAELPSLGYVGISGELGPGGRRRLDGLVEQNIHVDVLEYRPRGRFRGTRTVVGVIVGHLRKRRLGQVDADEATGMNTHHRNMDQESWAFLVELFHRTKNHPAARWIDSEEAFCGRE